MTPIDWAKRPLQRYAEFSGRAPRAEFWWYVLAVIVVSLVATILESLLGIGNMLGAYGPLTGIVALGLLIPNISVSVRRLHDTNRSGWWLLLAVPYLVAVGFIMRGMLTGDPSAFATGGLLSLLGFACFLVLVVFWVMAGSAGSNKYGPDPYGREAPATDA